jgi:hypothetical protein
MAHLDALHFGLKDQMEDLRDSIPELRDDAKYLSLFEEFLREHEFGLALETLCDFLLESPATSINSSLLDHIAKLHAAMDVRDECVARLMAKVV